MSPVKPKATILYCNLVGGNDELIFDGCSMAMDAAGNLFQLGKAFEEDFFVYDTENPSAKPVPSAEGDTARIYQALVLGTRDYVRKCGFERVLIGLSGGIDSALVAAIASEALGPENVMGVTMPSPFSSKGSIEDSRQLAGSWESNSGRFLSPLFGKPPFKAWIRYLRIFPRIRRRKIFKPV